MDEFKFDRSTQGKLKRVRDNVLNATAYLRGFGMGGSYTGMPSNAEINGGDMDKYHTRDFVLPLKQIKKELDKIEIIFTPEVVDQLEGEEKKGYLNMMAGFDGLIDFLSGKTKGGIVETVDKYVDMIMYISWFW